MQSYRVIVQSPSGQSVRWAYARTEQDAPETVVCLMRLAGTDVETAVATRSIEPGDGQSLFPA